MCHFIFFLHGNPSAKAAVKILLVANDIQNESSNYKAKVKLKSMHNYHTKDTIRPDQQKMRPEMLHLKYPMAGTESDRSQP